MSRPPMGLLSAFRAAESKFDQLGVLLVEDGFDAEAIRVLSAWIGTGHDTWRTPRRLCPDDGRPTAKAWAWLRSGWEFDHVSISRAAGVSVKTAREKIEILVANKLIYPDGSASDAAHLAIKAAIKERAGKGGKGKGKGKTEDSN